MVFTADYTPEKEVKIEEWSEDTLNIVDSDEEYSEVDEEVLSDDEQAFDYESSGMSHAENNETQSSLEVTLDYIMARVESSLDDIMARMQQGFQELMASLERILVLIQNNYY